MTKSRSVVLITIIAIFLLMGACAKPAAAPVPEPAQTPVPLPAPTITPAQFQVTSLGISPPEIMPGETANITATVKNIGGSEGSYAATLIVNGIAVEEKEVMIMPGSLEGLTFHFAEEAPGTYKVSIGELSSNLIIRTEEVEVKYDDGTSDGYYGIGGSNRGYGVYKS